MSTTRLAAWMLVVTIGLSAAAVAQDDTEQANRPEPLDVTLPGLRSIEALEADNVILAPIERGENDRAVELAQTRIEQASERGLREDLPDLYFQLAYAQREAGKPFDAALNYLRVVIHFPKHPLVLPAMERAGHALYEAGLSDSALTLWRKARDRAGQAEDAVTETRLTSAITAVENR